MNSMCASYFLLCMLASTLIMTEVHALMLQEGKRFFSPMTAFIKELFPAPVLPKTPTSSLVSVSKSVILSLLYKWLQLINLEKYKHWKNMSKPGIHPSMNGLFKQNLKLSYNQNLYINNVLMSTCMWKGSLIEMKPHRIIIGLCSSLQLYRAIYHLSGHCFGFGSQLYFLLFSGTACCWFQQ